jgi:hypothetical protein
MSIPLEACWGGCSSVDPTPVILKGLERPRPILTDVKALVLVHVSEVPSVHTCASYN